MSVINFVPLSSICEIGNGYAFKSEDFLSKGIPLLRISNIENQHVSFDEATVYLDESKLSKHENFIVSKGDVVIALSGATTGKYGIYLLDEPCLLNQRIGIIRNGKSEKLDSKYFYFYLNKLQSEIFSKAQGAAQPNISTKDIGSMTIPLPPLAEQQKIAAILDAADSLRQKDQQLVERYTALSQSLFLEMFGDPVTNPMGWKKKTLSDFISNLDTGVSVNSTDTEYQDTQFGILKTSCVYSGIFSPEQAKVIREDEFERAKLNPKADSIIISRMNTPELVGKSAYIERDFPMLFLPDRLWQSEKSGLEYSVKWLATAISFNSFMKEISKIASGTSGSMKNISKGKFLGLPITYPSASLQNQFAERIQLIEAQKQQAQLSLAKSDALFNSLLQRAFTGELTAKMAA